MTVKSESEGLAWLLDDLLRRLPGADRAIILSADGLLMARSRDLGADDADHLAAVASGLQSLARGVGRQFGGGVVRQTIIEMDDAVLFVTAAGAGACMAVLAGADVDFGVLAYELNLMVKRVGVHLSAQPRQSSAEIDAGAGWSS